MSNVARHDASFRDPAGHVFEHEGRLLRAVHPDAVADVEALFASGLYAELVAAGLLVAHERIVSAPALLPAGWLLLQPTRLEVISYATEWTDSQLLAAASLTLDLQRRALRHGLTLKDASSFNVQFVGARPVFIDLLSFTSVGTRRAWTAYKQFCEHFLAPLALRRHVPGLLASHVGLEGVALPLASRVLPLSTWLVPSLALHIHLHARASEAGKGKAATPQAAVGVDATLAFQRQLTASLLDAVSGLGARQGGSDWADYRANNVYSPESAQAKLLFVQQAIGRTGAHRALDLGANDGHYARTLVDMGVACTAVEIDAACSEHIYATSREPRYQGRLNTLRVDLTNPTPAHGWAHRERSAFVDRLRCDVTLALALVHHLAITHQVPFDNIARFLADLAPYAVVEYIPVADAMSQRLLAARTGVTPDYLATLSQESFEHAFARYFDRQAISDPLDGGRLLYHFARRAGPDAAAG